MSQKLSVVIPTLNAQHVLPSTLESLMEGVFAGVIGDLVIVDGGSMMRLSTLPKRLVRHFRRPRHRGGGRFSQVYPHANATGF